LFYQSPVIRVCIMKRLAITCFTLCFAICLAWMLAPSAAISQTATGPEQDCFGALPINRTLITQQISYKGFGVNSNEVSSGLGCASSSKTNSSWYRLDVASDGFLAFRLTAANGTDDYNFVVFRFPATAANQAAGCVSATSSASNIAACNFAPGGSTGLDNTLATQFSSFGQSLAVKRGETYMIYVSNKTGSNGFTLDFSTSSPGVIPTATTFPVATVAVRANQASGCGASSSLIVTFSDPILRGSVQPGTFTLTGNNQTFTINSVACANCPSNGLDSNTRKGVSYTLNFTPAISISGTYTLALSTTAGSISLRNVDNSLIAMPATPVIVNVGANLPAVISSLPIANNTTTFCLGQSVTLTTPDAGAGTQYQWLREGNGGALLPIIGGTSRNLNVTGSYAFAETPSTDSSSVVIVTKTVNFRVLVTDGNGCIRTSNPIAVSVSPGLQPKVLNAPTGGNDLRPCRNEGITLVAESGFRSYLWYKNFQAVDTAKSTTFFVRDAGVYAVETVDNSGCRNLSLSFTITPRDAVIPVIRGDSVNCANPTTGKADKPITLSVTPDESFSTYQWFDAVTKKAISGATGSIVAVTTGTYYLQVNSSSGCVVPSAPFTVNIGAIPVTPIINNIAGGFNVQLCPGSSQPLFATEGFDRYQWYRGGLPIDGATSRRYDAKDSGQYAVQVFSKQGCPSPLSNPPVSISNGAIIPGVVSSGSGSFTTCRGTSLQLSITIPDSLLSKATIEWTRASGGAVLGTSRTLTVSDAGQYKVSVQFLNNIPCPISTTVTVAVVDNPTPIVVTPTGGNTYCQGGSLTLDAGDFVTYQWFLGGTAISGATMRTLVVRAPGTYTVRVTASGGCSGTSAPFAVQELPAPDAPIIASRNASLTLCPNGSLDLFVQNANAALTYQWFKDNVALSGQTGTSLTVTAIGAYTVEAKSANGCTARPNAPANVTQGKLPTPPSFPSAMTICPNSDTTITAPTGFIGYQWLTGSGNSAQAIMGETNRTFRINRAGTFSLRVTDSLGCVNTSSTITVTQTVVTVTITSIDAGVRFQASSTPRARLFQWLLNGTNILGATDEFFAPQSSGSYSVRVTDINGCQQTSSAQRFDLPIVVSVPDTSRTTGGPTIPPVVRGDSAFAAPGDTVVYTIRLRSLGTLRPGAKIDATICFNATLLEPLPPLAAGTISGGVRCIPITLTIPSDTTAALFNLPFRAALGNDSVTALVITARLSPGGALLPTTASYFRLTTISYAGGPRLIGPAPRMRLTPSRPNPVGDDGTISYVIENAASNERTVETVSVTISDVYGQIVKTLPITQLIGKEGEIPFNTADLPRGVYFVTVRSRGAMQVQKIHVLR
jgi:hypothetical protein